MITINDIQIFITTHNRASLIKETLESLLAQTAKLSHITVLDNDSTDNTKEVVLSFSSYGVEYVATTGFLGNFIKARQLVNKRVSQDKNVKSAKSGSTNIPYRW